MPIYVTPEQRQKSLRIYAAALTLIAEGVGVDPKALHNNVLRRVLFKDLEQITNPPSPVPIGEPTAVRSAGGEYPASPADAPIRETHELISDSLQADTEPAPPEQKADDETLGAAPVIGTPDPQPAPEASPMIVLKPKSSTQFDEHVGSKLVTLKNLETGEWLHLSGQMMTTVRSLRYSGTVPQARAMRDKNPLAKGLSMRHYGSPKV